MQGRLVDPGAVVWPAPPAALSLPERQIHVWRASLDLPSVDLGNLWKTLSQDEQDRANRYRFERDRGWFIARRGLLRTILGRYLGLGPATLKFSYSAFGKPTLQHELGVSQLGFNLSHSMGLALFAFAPVLEVGVDIERLRTDFDHLELARRFFSAREQADLCALPAESYPLAFFLCWTRKEAFIKAHGQGLSLPLDQFEVTLAPGEPARLLATRLNLETPDQWSLYNLSPATGYLAALAVRGQSWQLQCWAEPACNHPGEKV